MEKSIKGSLTENEMLDLFIMVEKGNSLGASERLAKLLGQEWSSIYVTVIREKYRKYITPKQITTTL